MASKNRGHKVAIVIPTYQEKAGITRLVENIFRVLPDVNVVVVDDNSPDGTAGSIRKLTKKHRHLSLIERKGKGGRGSAVVAGFKFAQEKLKTKIFVEMDADFSHNPDELPHLIKLSQPKTIVIASRYTKGGRVINVPLNRRLLSQIANILIRLALKIPLKDNSNGLRCYQTDAVKILLKHKFISSGYILLSESARLLLNHGFSLVEIPSTFVNRKLGKSNARVDEFIHSLVGLIKIKRHLKV